jgi:ribosomal protein S18 acetylase RimI-like enzyme
MIKVRIANKYDAVQIAMLGRITFTETFGHLFGDKNDLLTYSNKTFSVSKIKSGFKNPNNIFFIAFVDNLPVGYAKLKLNSKSEFIRTKSVCQLQKIYVLGEFLSMKIGLQLQNLLLEKAKENKFDEIWLSVYEDNNKAIKFYEKNDFKTIGRHHFQIGKENFKFIAMSKGL